MQSNEKGLNLQIIIKACHYVRIHNEGGATAIYRFTNGREIDDPDTYCKLPPKSLILMLVHPGRAAQIRHDITEQHAGKLSDPLSDI